MASGRGRAWSRALPPDLGAVHALACAAFDSLPEAFRRLAGDVVLHVADYPEDDVLDALDIDDPLDLTGLYEGASLTERSLDDPAPLAAHVHLYRMPILCEWAERGDTTLGELIVHVLVHEIGHHFGLSDADMHAIEDAAD